MIAPEPPPDRAGGQDDPPDVRGVLQTVIRLLDDIRPTIDPADDDLILRVTVTRRVLIRTRDRLANP